MIVQNEELKIDSVIFDVDGTIWDSTPVVTEAWNKALIDTGHGEIQVTADRLKGLFGLPMFEIMDDILPNVSKEEMKVFEDCCNEYEEEFILKQSGTPYEGIAQAIAQISKKVPVFIISNCQSGYIELVIKHLKLDDFVTDFTCLGDTKLLKADNIKLIIEKHGLKNPVYVGDTQMDANACAEANVPIIYMTYGFGKMEKYAASADSAEELVKLVEKNVN